MSTRWKADGIPLWRKLFSSNWWWYGEVHPDPASLPPLEKRPKFWRGEVIFVFLLALGMPAVTFINVELNARYWPFNKTTTYVGRIVETRYLYPQLEVEMLDKKRVLLGFPMSEPFSVPNTTQRINRWVPMVDRLQSRQYDCPGQLLAFDAQPLNLTFRPFLNVWEVRCASGAELMSSKEIIKVWDDFNAWASSRIHIFCGLVLVFFIVLIIRRERKLYVKS